MTGERTELPPKPPAIGARVGAGGVPGATSVGPATAPDANAGLAGIGGAGGPVGIEMVVLGFGDERKDWVAGWAGWRGGDVGGGGDRGAYVPTSAPPGSNRHQPLGKLATRQERNDWLTCSVPLGTKLLAVARLAERLMSTKRRCGPAAGRVSSRASEGQIARGTKARVQ